VNSEEERMEGGEEGVCVCVCVCGLHGNRSRRGDERRGEREKTLIEYS